MSELERLRLRWRGAEALVYLQGAHVAEYSPAGSENILWLSESSAYQSGKAIRGGVPLCWPWFGPSLEPNRPQHGYARQSLFELSLAESTAHYARAVLRLDPTTAPFDEWRNKLELEVEIRLADSLWLELRTTNISDKPISISTCIHTYLQVADVRHVQLPDLLGLTYVDKLDKAVHKQQIDAFQVDQEVDRIYSGLPQQLSLIDPAGKNTGIQFWGCENLVVWNPWKAKAKQMADFDDQGYLKMICVEPANASPQSIQILPGDQFVTGQKLCVR